MCRATLILVAFQSFPLAHPDRPAMLILRQLLGGGSLFSRSGPGRGALSRLYKNCLLPNPHWVTTCNVFDMAYSDSGLFGATASSSNPGAGQYLFLLLLAQMQSLVNEITMDELRRAKAMAKSAFLMGVEEKVGALHELGTMVSTIGRKREMAREIDSVTLPDLKRVVETVFRGKLAGGSGRPTVVVLGKKAEVKRFQDDFVAEMARDFNLGRMEE
jgi:processing peptidase subunit alpha